MIKIDQFKISFKNKFYFNLGNNVNLKFNFQFFNFGLREREREREIICLVTMWETGQFNVDKLPYEIRI